MIRSMIRPMVTSMIKPMVNPNSGSSVVQRYIINLTSGSSMHYTLNSSVSLIGDFDIPVDFATTENATSIGLAGQSANFGNYFRIVSGVLHARIGGGATLVFTTPSPVDGKLNRAVLKRRSGVMTVDLNGIEYPEDSLQTRLGTANFDAFGIVGEGSFFDGWLANPSFIDKSGGSDVVHSWLLDKEPGNTEDSQQGGNSATYVNIPTGLPTREFFTLSEDKTQYDGDNGTTLVLGFFLAEIQGFRLARNSTTTINDIASFDLVINVSNDNNPAPLGIVFDAIAASTFSGIARPEHDLSFWWDFGDNGATFENIPVDHPFGNDANLSMGAISGHVFANDGVYTVKCFVYDHLGKRFGYAEKEITVLNTDAFFAGTKTVCLSLVSDFTGSPSGSTNVNTWVAAKSALEVAGDKRLLTRRGELIEINAEMDHRREGIKHYADFGDSLDPLPIWKTKDKPLLGFVYVRSFGDANLYNLDLQGDYDPITGVGEDILSRGMFGLNSDNSMMWHCKGSGLGTMFNINDITLNGGNIYQDNHCTDWYDFSVFGDLSNGICRGNSMKQNPLAVSGRGGKKSDVGAIGFSELGDNIKTAFAHGLDMDGNITKNLFVSKRDTVTGIITEMVEGVGYTATNPAAPLTTGVVTYTTAPTTTEDAYIYFRRWADHGPIRTARAIKTAIVHNDMLSNTGWSIAGSAPDDGYWQPCIRNHSEGVDGGLCYINSNKCDGVVQTGPANGDAQYNGITDTIIESNYVIGNKYTKSMIEASSTGVTVRNNACEMPDIAGATAFIDLRAIVQYQAWPSSTVEVKARPVNIYNNTILNYQSTANGAIDLVGSSALAEGGLAPTNLGLGNDLVHFPDAPTPLPDYLPLDLGDYGKPLTGSAAIDAGTSINSIVWDDFTGALRGSENTLGASE